VEAYSTCSVTDDAKEQTDRLKATQGAEISSTSLFCSGRNEVVIEHRGEQYRLRQTRNGKLILTK
jgi:hemin uptake protein HemP